MRIFNLPKQCLDSLVRMKKNYFYSLLIALLACSASAGFAQTATLSGYDAVLQDPTNQYIIDSHVVVENTSSNPVNFMASRTIESISNGLTESFCFGVACYAPGTAVSNFPTTIAGNSTEDFKASVNPNGNCGSASIHYKIYVLGNPADSVGVTLGFEFCATGLADNKIEYGVSKPTANPADNFTVLNYLLPSNQVNDKILVYNMIGSLVKTMDIPGSRGALVMSTSELKAGVYFVSYSNGGKIVSTSKLVVRH